MTNNFDRNQQQVEGEDAPFVERVVRISRVAKVVKGGRHLSFNAVVVVGDGEGHVGIGMGKADAVPDAVRKGAANARKNIVQITLKGSTIPHEVLTKYGGALVMMKPASPGTGVIAGGAVRAVVELAGVRDILTKARRSTNPVNVVKATFEGLKSLRDPQEEIRRRKALVESMAERVRIQAERRAARQARQAAAQAQATAPTE
ncbi:MAG: 30S ribosomal protein S5 [SAR202 cluster bacterium Io17-Chloro-G1]|nr:30S ribosomal protein S5 [Dehalococcoidia bacterium]PKB63238.1 MAG: 30S ribosomal protein S5 [SAR202 cluster bacterium Io17-Chloro-G1]